MASAQKCGGVQRKTTAKSTTGAQPSESVTADQPMSTGMQPAAPPQTMFGRRAPLEHSGVDDDVEDDRGRGQHRRQHVGGQPQLGDRRHAEHDAEDQRVARA